MDQTIEKKNPEDFGYLEISVLALKRVFQNKKFWFWAFFIPFGKIISLLSGVLGVEEAEEENSITMDEAILKINNFLEQYQKYFLGAIFFGLLLFAIWWLISIFSRGGLIYSINWNQEKPKRRAKFTEVWEYGRRWAKKIAILDLTLWLFLFLATVFVFSPFVIFSFLSLSDRAMAVFPVCFLTWVFLITISLALRDFTEIIVVMTGFSVKKSFEAAYHLMAANKKELLKLITLVTIGSVALLSIFQTIYLIMVLLLSVFYSFDISWLQIFLNKFSIFLGIFLVYILPLCLLAFWERDLFIWWIKKWGGVLRIKEPAEEIDIDKIPEQSPAS